MTFADKTVVVGREAASILELDLDGCARRYGISPCAATLALTNFLLRSEEINNGAWTKVNVTVTADQVANPENGATTADEILETTTDGLHRIGQIVASLDVTETWTWSSYVLPIGRDEIQIIVFNDTDTANNFRCIINIATGIVRGETSNGDSLFIKAGIRPVRHCQS